MIAYFGVDEYAWRSIQYRFLLIFAARHTLFLFAPFESAVLPNPPHHHQILRVGAIAQDFFDVVSKRPAAFSNMPVSLQSMRFLRLAKDSGAEAPTMPLVAE